MTNLSFDNGSLLKPKEAAAFIGYTVKTLASYRYRGIGPRFIKLGTRVVYTREDLQNFIDQNASTIVRAGKPTRPYE